MIFKSYRGGRLGSIGVMEDAKGKNYRSRLSCTGDQIQGTRHEQRPARMVGLLSLDSAQSSMEAGIGSCRGLPRFWGKG